VSPGILVVDDDPVTRRVVHAMLGTQADPVMCAASGHEALTILETFHPRLACIDLNMPGMGGLELISAMRARLGHAMPTVVVLTASGDPGDASRAIDHGADRYLTKPVSSREIAALAASDQEGRSR
jgi:CheY-like chemotaxis protein